MGAGAGAADILDNDLSPRFAAIEEAQAKLRQEVAVREERRRELDFLEKGGNPLDFQVGDVINPFGSSTDPLADQLLPIKYKASNGLQAGAVVENSCMCDITENNITDAVNNQHIWTASKPVSSGGSVEWDAKACCASNNCHDVVGNETELSSLKEREPARRTWAAARGQSYIRRNRHRVKWDGLGDLNARGDIENLSGKLGCGKISSGVVSAGNFSFENILLVDARCQTSLTAVDDAIGSQKFNAVDCGQCSPMTASVPCENADAILVTLPPATSTKSWTEESNVCAHLDLDDTTIIVPPLSAGKEEEDATRVLLLPSAMSQINSVRQAPWQPAIGVGESDVKDRSCQARHGRVIFGRLEKNSKLTRPACEGDVIGAAPSDGGCKDSSSQIMCGLTADDEQYQTGRNRYDLLGRDFSASSLGSLDCTEPRLDTAATGNTFLLAAKSDDTLLPCRMMFGPKNLRSDVQSSLVPFASELHAAEPDSFKLKDQGSPQLPSPGDDGRFQNQPAVPGSLAGLSRSNSRVAHPAGSSINRFPGVVLPWEKEQDPLVIAEAERRKATISAAAKRAQEDCVLEEAETIRASRWQVAELDRQRPLREPRRRKSHWDFVVEEMVWMANDFMQERLWKSSVAAQFVHSVAVVRLGCRAPKKDLSQMQRLVAHRLVDAVICYWQGITDSLHKGDDKAWTMSASSSGLAPMEVDVPESMKGVGSNRGRPVKEYCMRHIKEYMTMDFGLQVEAPSTPDREAEQPLIYTRSEDAFELYCESVTTHWAMIEAEHEQSRYESNAFAEAEGDYQVAGEELVSSDLAPEAGCMLRLSSPRKGSSDEEVYSHNLGGNSHIGGSMVNMIAKKKRRKIDKAIPAKFLQSMSGSGLSLDQPLGCSARMDYIFPSVSTGRRSSPGDTLSSVINVGTIPIKRLRTSAVAARQRAAGLGGVAVSPGIGGVLAGSRMATGLSQLQQQQESLLATSPTTRPVNCGSSSKVVQSVRSNLLFSKSKKKKKKHFGGAVYKASIGDGGAVELPNSSLKREHLKRKGEHSLLLGPSMRSSEAGSEDFDTPGSPDAPNKKSKLFKQPSDTSPDAATSASVAAFQVPAQLSNVSSKLVRQNCSRDRSNRKAKPSKVSSSQSGPSIPWSAAEDQAILHLVQSLGPNWELVSDVLRFNAQLKGIFRKPKHCREHHKLLVDHFSGEGGEGPNDLTLMQHPSTLSGSTKGLVEDTGKLHFEHIVHLVKKHNISKPKNIGYGQKQHVQIHPSHANIMSQYCASGMTGVHCTPLELCERSSTVESTAQQYQMQPHHGGGMGLPTVPSGSPSLRPGSAGMPGLQVSPPLTPSSVTGHTSTAREGQRLAQLRPFLQDEANQMRLARAAAFQRGLQPSVTTVTAGVPIMSPSDCTTPGFHPGSGPTIVGGLKRGMSLPRPGLSGFGSSMTSAGLGSMLPPGGVGINTGGLNPAAVVPAQMNIIRRPRDLAQLRSGRTTEEQRQILIQELQHQAVHGNAQAAAALSTFNNSLSTSLASSPPRNFASPQQLQSSQPLVPHQPSQLNQLQHPQQQAHAYYGAQVVKERQMQQQQAQRILQQQHSRQKGNSAQVQPQSPSAAQQQQAQGHVHPQHSHAVTLQPQVGSQRQLSMQSQHQQLLPPSSFPTSSVHQPSPLPPTATTSLPKPGALTVSHCQQVTSTSQATDQPQLLHGKLSTKQAQKHQQVHSQVQSRVLKSAGHGGSAMQGLAPQAALSGGLSGHLTTANQLPSQRQSIHGPRSLQTHTPKHLGKQLNQASHQVLPNRFAGKPGQLNASTQVQAQVATQGLILPAQQNQQQQSPKGQGSGSMPGKHQPGQNVSQTPAAAAAAAVSATLAKSAAVMQPLLPTSPTALVSAPSVTSPTTGQPPVHLPSPQSVSTTGPAPTQAQFSQMQLRQHQQPVYRRLPLRQPSSSIAQQVTVQVTKSGTQQVVQTQLQPVRVPFQLSPIASSPLSMGMFSSGVAVPSSSSLGVHSQWRPSQPLSPVSASTYSPKKACSAGVLQVNTLGSPMRSSAASIGVSTTSAGMLAQGVEASILVPQQCLEPVGSAHGHALGPGGAEKFGDMLQTAAQPQGGPRPAQELLPVKTVGFGPVRLPSSADAQHSNSCLGAEGAYSSLAVNCPSQGSVCSWTDQTAPNLRAEVQTLQLHSKAAGTAGAIAQRIAVKMPSGDMSVPCAPGTGSAPSAMGALPAVDKH